MLIDASLMLGEIAFWTQPVNKATFEIDFFLGLKIELFGYSDFGNDFGINEIICLIFPGKIKWNDFVHKAVLPNNLNNPGLGKTIESKFLRRPSKKGLL